LPFAVLAVLLVVAAVATLFLIFWAVRKWL
jgi:hypothetical protein